MKEESISASSSSTTKISFKIPLKPKKSTNFETNIKFVEYNSNDDGDLLESRKRAVTCLENGVIKGEELERKKVKKEYCINIEKTYDWRIQKLQKLVELNEATDDDKARLALMLEAFGGASFDNTTANTNIKTISAEAGNNEVGSLLDADYEAVPIGEFGRAFLRGCGWKEGEGIGRTNKCVVPLHITEARPKGLGLGAHVSSQPPPSRSSKNGLGDEMDTTLKKYRRVKITAGQYKGVYAEVRSLDEDNSSCFVELLNGRGEHNGKIIRVSKFFVELLSDGKKPSSSSSSSSKK